MRERGGCNGPTISSGLGGKVTLSEHAHIIWIDEVGGGPAVEVVFGHALIGEALPALVLARADRRPQRIDADLLVASGVVDLVELVAGAGPPAPPGPPKIHPIYPLDPPDAARSTD